MMSKWLRKFFFHGQVAIPETQEKRLLLIFAWVLFCSFKREEELIPRDSRYVGTKWIGSIASSALGMPKNTGLFRTSPAYGFGSSCVVQMERRVGVRFSLHLPQPTDTRKADRQCEDYLESHAETSRCAAFSDLRPAACFLHATKLGSAGRHNSKGNASHQPRDKAPVSTRHGRAGS